MPRLRPGREAPRRRQSLAVIVTSPFWFEAVISLQPMTEIRRSTDPQALPDPTEAIVLSYDEIEP